MSEIIIRINKKSDELIKKAFKDLEIAKNIGDVEYQTTIIFWLKMMFKDGVIFGMEESQK